MRIVTWNVNSLRARSELVELFLDEERPDVLGLQELKMETSEVPRALFEDRGYHLAIHGQKSWNGVLVASRSPVREIQAGLPGADEGEARMIAVETAGIALVNLYCPQGQTVDSPKFPFKLGFYDGLLAWLEERLEVDRSWIVLGDLNVAPREEDVWSAELLAGIPTFHPEEHVRWARLLELGLHDLVAERVPPGTFTFWDYRGGAFRFDQGMRIDHVLGNDAARGRVQGARVGRDWRKKKAGLTPSDHAPVFVELGD